MINIITVIIGNLEMSFSFQYEKHSYNLWFACKSGSILERLTSGDNKSEASKVSFPLTMIVSKVVTLFFGIMPLFCGRNLSK